MALTQGNWSVEGSFNGVTTWTCTVTVGATETDSYTLRTPVGLDPRKPWTLLVNTAGTDLDGQAVPVDLWVGTSGDAALSGQGGSVAGTDAYNFKQIIADVDPDAGVAPTACLMDPTLTTADVANVHVKVPVAACYIFNLDGGSAMINADCIWKIVQDGSSSNSSLDSKYNDIGGDGTTGIGPDPS